MNFFGIFSLPGLAPTPPVPNLIDNGPAASRIPPARFPCNSRQPVRVKRTHFLFPACVISSALIALPATTTSCFRPCTGRRPAPVDLSRMKRRLTKTVVLQPDDVPNGYLPDRRARRSPTPVCNTKTYEPRPSLRDAMTAPGRASCRLPESLAAMPRRARHAAFNACAGDRRAGPRRPGRIMKPFCLERF